MQSYKGNMAHQDRVPANNAKGGATQRRRCLFLRSSENVILEGPGCQILMSVCKKPNIFYRELL